MLHTYFLPLSGQIFSTLWDGGDVRGKKSVEIFHTFYLFLRLPLEVVKEEFIVRRMEMIC